MMQPQRNHEHRWSPCRAVETTSQVYANGQQPWPGCIRNLSIGGLFAAIDAKTLSPNDTVDVAFVLHRGDVATHHRLPARVMWVGHDGAGLLFTDFCSETLQVLWVALGSGIA